MIESLADKLQRLCCAETEGAFFDCVTDNISEIVAALRLATNPPDPDSMNDKRALQDMDLASNVREATIREFAKKPLPYGWTQEHAVKAAWMIGTLAITPIDEWKSKDELYAQLSEFRILHQPPTQDKPK